MGKRDRAFVAEAVFGVLRWWRRLRHAAGERSEDRKLLVLLYLELFGYGDSALDLPVAPGERSALEDAVLRFREPALPHDPVADIGIVHSLPDWLVAAWLETLPQEVVEARCKALKEPAPLAVRANPLKADRDAVQRRLLEEGFPSRPAFYSPLGLVLEGKGFVYGTGSFREGWFEVQDEGSQLIGFLAEAKPGQVVVDGCAGGGGKTLHLAAMMEDRGELYAFDVSGSRLRQLAARARRAGVRSVRLRVLPRGEPAGRGRSVLDELRGRADVVLVDAPCSGTGVLRRNPEAAWKLTGERIGQLVREQQAILEAYAPLVRPGGRLVYATCSLLPQENEAVVERFLECHPEFALQSAVAVLERQGISVPGQYDLFLRLDPAVHGTDGFFGAVLIRKSD
ncbi:MAG: NOL1/NOP2/Sun family protein [Gemmatimonadales bacterium]|nr:MAG: NOL1/NOP2/Sun family protein [Gemmatimonadales bacterium]